MSVSREGAPMMDAVVHYWGPIEYVLSGAGALLGAFGWFLWRLKARTDANTREIATIQANCKQHHERQAEERREYREDVKGVHKRLDSIYELLVGRQPDA